MSVVITWGDSLRFCGNPRTLICEACGPSVIHTKNIPCRCVRAPTLRCLYCFITESALPWALSSAECWVRFPVLSAGDSGLASGSRNNRLWQDNSRGGTPAWIERWPVPVLYKPNHQDEAGFFKIIILECKVLFLSFHFKWQIRLSLWQKASVKTQSPHQLERALFFGPDASLASKSFAILAYIMLCDLDSDPSMWFILYLEVLIGRLLV